MQINRESVRRLLRSGELQKLFIEELGWNYCQMGLLEVPVDEHRFTLTALAEKRGFVVFHCPIPAGVPFPDYNTRRRVEKVVAKNVHEHLIIFSEDATGHQVWQWVRREAGKPIAQREFHYHSSQTGEALLQRLESIAFSLEEEEHLDLFGVTSRVRIAFDVERVTKRFYEEFRKYRDQFLQQIKGIPNEDDRAWYASVMLNRLMFLYFIQKKGFLDGDSDYLRNRLRMVQQQYGQDKFYSFYRTFLLRLFHEGLAQSERTPELQRLLGTVPYLDGGIFEVHPLERPDRYGNQIQIPDKAFERIFDFFDRYRWYLDERPLRADNEINPDVLGYIFEKYINQKEMGAYYTKEDITDYICKNTLIPYLFDAARRECKIAFDNPNGPTVWDLLRENPDRYLYPAMKHGVIREDGSVVPESELPDFVQRGMHDPRARMFDNRYNLQQAEADDPIRLVTETWREYVNRRNRCLEVRQKLLAGEVRNINDLITYNLDIRQFAQDVIASCDSPDLLRAFWKALREVSVLDPTCGSGAFLFAALNILESLYEGCLERMEAFLEDLQMSGEKHHPDKFRDFREALAQVEDHPNRRYFIYKSIILNNLYGVDIMEEAVEICKLRLFLKLAAQVEPDLSKRNLGVEPLPDIDFNIRAGNTLVGYATYDDVQRALQSRLDLEHAAERILQAAADLQQAFAVFRRYQLEGQSGAPEEHKRSLQCRLDALNQELHRYLAYEYGVDLNDPAAYARWLRSHQPFHWFVEFYHVVHERGGFDVIVGNPPYVEYSKVRREYNIRGYQTEECGNLYAFTWERSIQLSRQGGRTGLVVPSSAFTTKRMLALNRMMSGYTRWLSFYDFRPAKLFDGVNLRLAIGLLWKSAASSAFSTTYNRWYCEERQDLFTTRITYQHFEPHGDLALKLGSSVEQVIWKRMQKNDKHISDLVDHNGSLLYYYDAILYWIRATDFLPEHNGYVSSHVKDLGISTPIYNSLVCGIMNSNLFFWYWTKISNCRDLGVDEVLGFPLPTTLLHNAVELQPIVLELMRDLLNNSEVRTRNQRLTGVVEYREFYPVLSKPIINRIDEVLARHYGFTDEELDFIINYDIKYRMGKDAGEEDG